jgi:hypothetical protein
MKTFVSNNAVMEARNTAKHRRAVRVALKANPAYVSIDVGLNRHARRAAIAVARKS